MNRLSRFPLHRKARADALAAWSLLTAALGFAAAPPPATDVRAAREQIAALGRLVQPPQRFPAAGFPAEGALRPLFFEALPWKGNATRVFAWLGLPEAGAGAKVPGIVLVHGGGGTAYKDWVRKWNAHGFAAIAIAVEGQTDEMEPGAPRGAQWKRHASGGPPRNGIYGDSAEPLADQWMYHAVADTILARLLLAAEPGVDRNTIGLAGISWGGVITSTVIGIDAQFAFAIPIYGCGHLADAENQYGRALGANVLYREAWDPMVRIDRVRMPVLWLSWPGDEHFPLDCQAACYRAAPGPRMVTLRPNMRHSHPAGWNPPESYAFAQSIVREGQPWLRQVAVRTDGDRVEVEFACDRRLEAAMLIATPDRGFTGKRTWTETPATFERHDNRYHVGAELPAGTRAWFVNVRSGDVLASSDFMERTP